MQLKSAFSLVALAIALAATPSAKADPVLFSLSQTNGVGSTSLGVTLAPGSIVDVPASGPPSLDAQGAGTDVNFAFPTISAEGVTTPTTVSLPFSYTLTIHSDDNPVDVVFTVSGSVNGTYTSGQANNTSVTTFAIAPLTGQGSPVLFTLTNAHLPGLSPTPGGANGTLTIHVAGTAVPEPASVALLGLGGVGLVGLVARRRRTA